jgi:hypothetical protein
MKTLFNSDLRERIEPQILDYKNKTDLSYCRKCNCSLTVPHIDHDEPQFQHLVDDFVDLKIMPIPTEYNKKMSLFNHYLQQRMFGLGSYLKRIILKTPI